MNTVIILGQLTRDAEIKQTKSGASMLVLSVADNASKKDEATIFWDCAYFGDHFSKMVPWLKKGSAVIIDGEMNPPRMYQKQDGSTGINMSVKVSNIRFSPFKSKDTQQVQQQTKPAQTVQQQPQQEIDFGECPF